MNYHDSEKCRVCGKPQGWHHCTNHVCQDCHLRFCSSGGNDSPGHGINVDAARAALTKIDARKNASAK